MIVFNLVLSSLLLEVVTSTCELNTSSIRYWVQQYALDNTVCGGNIGGWDISNVQELSSTFANLPNFNADLSGWNVRNIVKMDQTFMDAVAFNGNIENWNVARVTDMGSMFSGAEAFNIDISGWDMSSVTSIEAMLNGAEAFDRDITTWQLSSVVSGGFTSSIGGLSSYDDCQKEELFDAWNGTYQFFRDAYGSATSTDSSFYAAVCNATTEPGNPQSSDDTSGLIAIGSIIVVGLILVSSCIGMLAVRRMYAPGTSAADRPVSSSSGAADYY